MKEDISLKIKADTSQAKKDIEKLGKKDIEIKAKLKKPEKNFFKELEQEANELGKKVSDIKLKKESFSKDEVTELKKEIENTALKAKTIYFSEGNKSAEELIKRLKEMHKVLGQNKSEIKNTEKLFTKMDAIVLTTFQYIATKGIEAMKQLVSEGMKFSRELEYADKKIQSISDKSSIEIQSNIGELSLETGTDPIELRNGLYEIISAVGDVDEAYNLLRTSNKLAITGFTDIGNAVDGLTTVLNAYQMQLSEADRIANVFVKTQKLGKITVDEFARDLAQSVPYATQLGIKIEEIGSAIALLTSRGVKPAQAETQLASFLRNILDGNNELAKELNKSFGMGIKEYIQNGGDLIKIIEEISNIENRLGKAITSFSMDSEAKAFILTLKDGKEAYKNFYKEISNGNNIIDKSMASMMNSHKAALDRAKTYWQELGRTAGNTANQIISYLGDIITGFDREVSATTILNSNLKQSLQTLQELGSKNNKTAEEQKDLNEALNFLSVIAPEISEAYRNWCETGGDYAEVLKLIEERQKKVNDISNQMSLKNFDKDISDLEKELNKAQAKIRKMAIVDPKTGLMLSTEEQVKQGIMSETFNSDKFLEYTELKNAEKELQNLLSDKKKSRKQYVDKILGKTGVNDVIEAGKNISVIGELDLSPQSSSIKSEEELEKLKEEKEKEYKKRELEIEITYNNARLKATQEYNKQMAELKGKGTEEEIKAIKEAYQKALNQAEYNKDIADINNKMNNTYYSTESEKELNNKYLQSQKDFLEENNLMELEDEERTEAEKKLKESLDNVSSNLKNLSSLFQTIGDNTNSTSLKNLANIGSLGSTIFETMRKANDGDELLGKLLGTNVAGLESISSQLGNIGTGASIGKAISGAMGGDKYGDIGGTIGAVAGSFLPIPGGSVIGSTIGSTIGSVFGRSSKKKKKREERKRRAAQERLKQGMISGQFKWADVLEEYNEDLQRAGAGEYINLLDKVSTNTNYDNVLSTLNSAKRGADGVSMSALKQLMPQYTESQIMDWFKSITGGAVLNGDTLSTGEGKYGAIDISALAQQVTNANREMEQSLKETIKNIIDFSADSLASVVKEGFFDGLDNLGDNIEKMIANSLKNAFINTELSKNLFNGLSDKVSDYVKDLFKNDKNLGIDLETGSLEKLTFTQYIELIKKYMEMSNDKLEELFKELGLNMDNLTESMDSLNKNMSKNVVSGIATNLWKQNLGIKEPYKINQNIHLEIPVMLNGKEMDRYIIKTVNGSLQRSRRSGNGIGRG